MDSIHINSSKCIDSIAIMVNLLDYIEGSILLESYELIPLDHHRYIIDLNLEDYFEDALTIVEKISYKMINLSSIIHREKFKEAVEKRMEVMNFEQTFYQRCNRYATKEIIE